MRRRNKNFRFFEEKCKNVLQGRGFCIEKKEKFRCGVSIPLGHLQGGLGWSKYAIFCVFT